MEYGLIGAKLGHSHSPRIHRAFFDYDYVLRELTAEELPGFLARRDFKGLNVTIPYKQAVLPFCDALGERARRIGSVNTLVVRPDGSLYGDNTDHYGMCYAIRRCGMDLARKHVLILGSGGTSLTARAEYEAELEVLLEKIRALAREIAGESGLELEITYADPFPETRNDDRCAGKVRAASQALGLTLCELYEPRRGSEDFGHIIKAIPGCLFRIGDGPDCPPTHTYLFDFPDEILETAVDMFRTILSLP